MRKYIFVTVLLVLAISCKNFTQEQTTVEEFRNDFIVEPKNETHLIIKSFQEISESDISENAFEKQILKENQNKLKIKFSKIDSTNYLDFKHKYSNGVETDPTIANKYGDLFFLIVKNEKKGFGCDTDHNNCNYYKGFLKPLNKYILTYCETDYCRTYLLDKNTGMQHYLESPFDSESNIPCLSKEQDKLIAFSSSVFKRESFVAIYKKNTKTKEIEFSEFESFYTSDWRIKEIVWVNNNSIALKVFEKYGKNPENKLINVKYLRGKLE